MNLQHLLEASQVYAEPWLRNADLEQASEMDSFAGYGLSYMCCVEPLGPTLDDLIHTDYAKEERAGVTGLYTGTSNGVVAALIYLVQRSHRNRIGCSFSLLCAW